MSEVNRFNLHDTFVAMDDDCNAWPLPVSESFWQDLCNGRLGQFSQMVSLISMEKDWTTWEKHPAGQEFACLVNGNVTLRLELSGTHQDIELEQSGQSVLIPCDTWHTALVKSPSQMLFITPGEGTENRPIVD